MAEDIVVDVVCIDTAADLAAEAVFDEITVVEGFVGMT